MMEHALRWITVDHVWLLVGFLGQALFASRFILQWFKSEMEGRSVIPVNFWYCSLGGGVVLLAYAIHKLDPVFILGQASGLIVYGRNLYLIFREREALREQAGAGA
ncbi:MAG TPA: lipid-A-disaccharide synthase N-terminal domain-containing protein [Rhizomicrobium sp.]|nr:lipid-A-disaccharide synthase N-terminal domain-containing protein [Rhizomicrobium sp.]